VHSELLRTTLIEDLNRLACPEAQDRLAGDESRVREALGQLRWIDTTELPRYRRDGWLDAREADLIHQFVRFAAQRLSPIPAEQDALVYTRADPDWQAVRERAAELVRTLDAFIDIGVPGWGQDAGHAS
jgi:hypothetical protein